MLNPQEQLHVPVVCCEETVELIEPFKTSYDADRKTAQADMGFNEPWKSSGDVMRTVENISQIPLGQPTQSICGFSHQRRKGDTYRIHQSSQSHTFSIGAWDHGGAILPLEVSPS
jgi:hypothetical protein